MFVVHPKPGQWIAVYDSCKNFLGTMKLSVQKNGHVGLVLDFDRSIRFDTKYRKEAPPPRAFCQNSTFGDYEPPDYDVPIDADND